MVRARGPSRGADWIARERGLTRPNVQSSSSLFEQKGNPWRTKREQNEEYPLNRSSAAEKPETEFEKKARVIRRNMRLGLGEENVQDFMPPRPSVIVDPDMDCFTKAMKAEVRPEYVDPKGKPTPADFQRKAVNIAMAMRANLKALLPEEYTEVSRVVKVKGSFYRFTDVLKHDRTKKK